MLTPHDLRALTKKHMGPVFEKDGFKYKYEGKGATWAKSIDDGTFQIGIGLFIDARNKEKLEFRFTEFFDPEDIRDIRAYRYSGWPPRATLKALGVKVSLLDRLLCGTYDAWVPFPTADDIDPAVLEEYAQHLLRSLYSKVERGKRWTKGTHRWEYE